MKRTLLCIFSLMLLVTVVWAVPARRGTFTHTQKDGTVLTLMLVGDEHMHYCRNAVTGVPMELGEDGDYYPIATFDFAVREDKAATRRTAANRERLQRLPRLERPRKVGSFTTVTGKKKGLVILVNFQDVQFKSANNQAAFNNQFNQEGYSKNGHIGSVRDYFKAQSYGQFDLEFDVVGPVTVSQNMAYYGGNDSNGSDLHPAEMIIEALKLADTQFNVDYTQYDWGGDGYVDQVFVIYAGYCEAQGAAASTIWPHEWTLSSAKYYGDGGGRQRIDGKYIDTYACTGELCGTSGSTMDGIGTACHEFSHCLGYPDLYDTHEGVAWGMDAFDLMDYGSYSGPNGHGEVPCGYSAYERWMAGWLEPLELTEPFTVSAMASLSDEGEAYVVYNDNNRNEYFIFENRQNRDWFRYCRKGTTCHGMLVTHVDYNSSAWSGNTVNADATHQRYTYVAADGTYASGSLAGDLFPGTGKVTAFNDNSHVSAGGTLFNKNTNNTYKLGKPVANISETNGLISFDFMGGSPIDVGTRYTITLDPCAGTVSQTSWTQPYSYSTWTLPEPQCNVPDWAGIGWSKTPITTDTHLDDIIDNIIDYDAPYLPESDVTLYAVYANNEEMCNSHPAAVNYTVIFNACAGTCDGEASWTQTADMRHITLPTASASAEGWSFAGWATMPVSETTTLPTVLKAGRNYVPTADITLYAVYTITQHQTGDDSAFRLVSTPTEGYEYVIASSNMTGSAYTLDAARLSGTATATFTGTATTIVDSHGTPAVAAASETEVWTCAANGSNKWLLMNGDQYLRINGSGFSLQDWHKKLNDLFWSESVGLYGKSSSGSTSYYVHSEGSTIKTTQSGNAANRVYLYECVSGNATVTYYNSNPVAQLHTVAFNAGTGSCTMSSWTQTGSGMSISLPTAAINVDRWTFAGWASSNITDTTTKPTLRLAGTNYEPVSSVTLYAVYTATSYEGNVVVAHYNSNPEEAPADVFYTITYNNCGVPTQWMQTAGALTATLPEVSSGLGQWMFAGWAASPVEPTTVMPTLRAAGTTLTPNTSMTLYAVFYNGKAYTTAPDHYVPSGGTANPNLYYPHIAYVGKPFKAPQLITNSAGALRYVSSNSAVAEVNEASGEVTIVGVGIAIITVTQAESNEYAEGSASYMIKVINE